MHIYRPERLKKVEKQVGIKELALTALAMNVGKEFPNPLMSMWLKLLEPYSDDIVSEAVMGVIREYEYKAIPNFAVLQKQLDRLSGKLPEETTLALEAEAEWKTLLDEVAKRGIYSEPELHPTTEYVLRCLGGWEVACGWKVDELKWHRRDFIEVWKNAHGHIDRMEQGAEALEGRMHLQGITSAILGCEEDDEEPSLAPGM